MKVQNELAFHFYEEILDRIPDQLPVMDASQAIALIKSDDAREHLDLPWAWIVLQEQTIVVHINKVRIGAKLARSGIPKVQDNLRNYVAVLSGILTKDLVAKVNEDEPHKRAVISIEVEPGGSAESKALLHHAAHQMGITLPSLVSILMRRKLH